MGSLIRSYRTTNLPRVIIQNMNTNPYAPPAAHVDDVSAPPAEAAPPLWNPSAAAKWSLLFTPIFGAALHMKNWQALGEQEKAKESKKWLIGSIGFSVLILVLGFILPESKTIDTAFRGAGFGLLITWYFQSAKLQIGYVAARFGTSYPRKTWGRPFLYAFGCFLAFVAVAAVIAFVTTPSQSGG